MHAPSPPPVIDAAKLEEYRQRVAGTNIDGNSLLSTDYFNTFNSIIMILDMLPDAPDMIEEVEQWRFMNYTEHFKASGLEFADLAVEAYEFSPPELKEAFERKAESIRIIIESTASILRRLFDIKEMDTFSKICRASTEVLHSLMQEGNGIVHGGGAIGQEEIDKIF